ncbi:DUF3987 domain-containing protein [Paraburkholderia sp. LEh10]|uniref:DUF3987 domain-containing protein n=1 Tax=Paraburkholderia sp. LEh10 TaxID=2821353 RepID=UPI001AE5DE27|nr:DUF3987 domain-containing protein [Paraburkholderia sp. LEh10]MBP0594567.1 DUF3987 domain-containing protein [Paraburkholderia sp. LEh10]
MINNSCQDVALGALSVGLCAIPAAGHTNPSNPKKPFGAWLKYQRQQPSPTDLRNLYTRYHFTTVGLVCGKISDGLECLDFDTIQGYQAFQRAAKNSELAPLIARIEAGYAELSPKGAHLLYFCEGVGGSKQLNHALKIETRGEGGFVVIAPTTFAGEDGRKQYQLTSGALSSIARILPAEREQLHSFIRALGAPDSSVVNAAASRTALRTIEEGGRNNSLASLAGALRSRGVSDVAMTAALHAENKAHCTPPLPDSEVDAIVRSVCRYPPGRAPGVSAPIVWNAPLDLPKGMPVAPALNAGLLLPGGLSDWVSDTAYRLQCPPDYPAIGLLVSLSAVIGGRLAIRPKQLDNWTVTPNLWGMIIGRPSTLKSPAMSAALAPMNALERDAFAKFQADLLNYEAQKAAHAVTVGNTKNQGRGKSGQGQPASVLATNLAAVMQQRPVAPVQKRYIVNDVTVEKLGEILAENPNGALLFRDELKGFLAELEGEENANKRGFVLQAWTGDGGYNFDRIGRGHVRIPRAILSVLGTTQPGVIETYLNSAMRGGIGDDGLIQRFQLAVYPEEPVASTLVDKLPDVAAADFVSSLFKRLAALDPFSIGAERDNVGGGDDQWYLRFSAKAQRLYDDWYKKLMRHIQRAGDGAVASHYGKYRSLVPSLALIFHLTEGRSGPVDEAVLYRAIGWALFLKQHAEKIYHYSIRSDARAACALGDAIKEGKLNDRFTLREVRRKCWAGLTTQPLCQQAIDILAEHHWLFVERGEINGRGVERYRINPALIKQ